MGQIYARGFFLLVLLMAGLPVWVGSGRCKVNAYCILCRLFVAHFFSGNCTLEAVAWVKASCLKPLLLTGWRWSPLASAVAYLLAAHANRRNGQYLPAEVHVSGFQLNHPQLSTLPPR
uniref:Uncharacterized protein n=1 Tax=Erwinia amylovora ATCC BAA-2158 TaxID=889211 RepID=E5B9H7_ERWAM|nr:hypothetical protein EAIL5_3369 [Erwinia amylovora ATCC BAA-2158]